MAKCTAPSAKRIHAIRLLENWRETLRYDGSLFAQRLGKTGSRAVETHQQNRLGKREENAVFHRPVLRV